MKKLFIVLAVATLGFVACNNDSEKSTATDTTATVVDTMPAPTDTMPAPMDTTAKPATDTSKKN